MPGQDPPVNNSAKYLQQISSKMLFIDCFVIRCAHTNTHTYGGKIHKRTIGPCRLEGLHCLVCIIVCVYVSVKALSKKVLDNEVCHRGMWISLPLLPSLPLLFLSQSPFTSGSPADKEQGSGWREEKGMDWGGKKEKVRNWRKGSVFEPKFPPCRKSKLHNVIVIV